jgi:hypothetical protein
MQSNEAALKLDSGAAFDLVEQAKSGPYLLVFLRHLGCLFCRQQVSLLQDVAPDRLLFVSHGSQPAVQQFKQVFSPNHRIVSDPEMQLYTKFGLKKGGIGQMLNPLVIIRGAQASARGHRQTKPGQDPWVLGGWVLIGPNGEPLVCHAAKDAADVLSAEDALKLLAREG